jgi:hypothetical protein
MNWNWNETTIDSPLSSENLKNLLNTVCRKENRFSQFEFIKWCDNLTMAYVTYSLRPSNAYALFLKIA